jgi:hypothetical protein
MANWLLVSSYEHKYHSARNVWAETRKRNNPLFIALSYIGYMYAIRVRHRLLCVIQTQKLKNDSSMLFLSVIKWPSQTPDTETASMSITFTVEFMVHNGTLRYSKALFYVTRRATGVHNFFPL